MKDFARLGAYLYVKRPKTSASTSSLAHATLGRFEHWCNRYVARLNSYRLIYKLFPYFHVYLCVFPSYCTHQRWADVPVTCGSRPSHGNIRFPILYNYDQSGRACDVWQKLWQRMSGWGSRRLWQPWVSGRRCAPQGRKTQHTIVVPDMNSNQKWTDCLRRSFRSSNPLAKNHAYRYIIFCLYCKVLCIVDRYSNVQNSKGGVLSLYQALSHIKSLVQVV